MTKAHRRFARWVAWTGLSQAEIAERLECSAAMVSFLCRGERTVAGLKLALAIEREMKLKRADGAKWDGQPIEPSEWAEVATGTAG
jgi:transcriptional regulator with XRE-family HTH domain